MLMEILFLKKKGRKEMINDAITTSIIFIIILIICLTGCGKVSLFGFYEVKG